MQIQVLYFRGCPHREPTIELVQRVARSHGVTSPVEAVEVRSAQDAAHLRFLGSPTVRVNGVDVDPNASDRTDFAMVCRLYGTSGVPPAAFVEAAIHEAPECG